VFSNCFITRSSAIADRQRDALCLSVVSFSDTIPRPQSFIIVTFAVSSASDLP